MCAAAPTGPPKAEIGGQVNGATPKLQGRRLRDFQGEERVGSNLAIPTTHEIYRAQI
jgi:hypothetical protein